MNQYLNNLLFGKKENRILILEAAGVPDTRAALPDEAKTKPHICVDEGVVYLWNVDAQEWIALLASSNISLIETADQFEYQSHTLYGVVLLKNVGLFAPLETDDDPDMETTFPSNDAGWLWNLWLGAGSSGGGAEGGRDKIETSADFTYEQDPKDAIRAIDILSLNGTQTIRIGSTPGGDDLMLDTDCPEGQFRGVSKRIYPVDPTLGDYITNIYFTGFTAEAVVLIHKDNVAYQSL